MANPTHIENKLKNINIDGVENCNLLCKLIIDYLPSENCLIKSGKATEDVVTKIISQKEIDYTNQVAVKELTNYSYLEIPPGSFINYRDTSYEATQMVFFAPSRHTIDNERFDFEVNIHHGTFIEGEGISQKRKGIVSHAHYKSNTEAGKTYNMDYHYHTNENKVGEEPPHDESYVPESKKNMVTCILFNIADHQGTNTNVFFNQFINNENFKHRNFINYPLNIKTHEGWSIEDLLPKRRSFFIYDDSNKNNTYIVFDSINSIDKGIVDILKHHIFKPEPTPENRFLTGISNVLYKNNIEVITDSKYKQHMREQIKLLLGIHRTSMRISDPLGSSKDFNDSAAKLYQKVFSGSYRNYRDDAAKAKSLTEAWSEWGKGKMVETKVSSIPLKTHDEIFTDNKVNANSGISDFADYKFNPEEDYLKEFEKQNKVELDKFVNECAEPYKSLDKFREILYRFNIQIEGVEGLELGIKEVPLTDLGIQKLNTELSITDLFMLLNMVTKPNKPPLSTTDIYITGYEGNYNFYLGDISSSSPVSVNLESSKLKQVDNLLYVPNINEDLNQTSTDKVLYTEKVVLIKYSVKFMNNSLVQFLGGLGGNIVDLSASQLVMKTTILPELYRLMIQTDSTLKYTGAHNLLDYQFVTVEENEITDQTKVITKCSTDLKSFCDNLKGKYYFTNLIRIHIPSSIKTTATFAASAAINAAAATAATVTADSVSISTKDDADAAIKTAAENAKLATDAATAANTAAIYAATKIVGATSYGSSAEKQSRLTELASATIPDATAGTLPSVHAAAATAAAIAAVAKAAADASGAAVTTAAMNAAAGAAAMNAAAGAAAAVAAFSATAATAATAADAATAATNAVTAISGSGDAATAADAALKTVAVAAATPTGEPLYNMYKISLPKGILKHFIFKTIKTLPGNMTVLNMGNEFNTTINGDVCQNWNSHQVHHEGGFWDSFRKVPKFPVEGREYDFLNKEQLDYIKDGLVIAEEVDKKDAAGNVIEDGVGNPIKVLKMKTHNKCRNPGNSKSAPWCYTKNPNKRWDYCVKPDHSHRFAKIVLLITTLMFIAIAYVTVKMIFKKQYFSAFIARLTGGTVAGGAEGAAAK